MIDLKFESFQLEKARRKFVDELKAWSSLSSKIRINKSFRFPDELDKVGATCVKKILNLFTRADFLENFQAHAKSTVIDIDSLFRLANNQSK